MDRGAIPMMLIVCLGYFVFISGIDLFTLIPLKVFSCSTSPRKGAALYNLTPNQMVMSHFFGALPSGL